MNRLLSGCLLLLLVTVSHAENHFTLPDIQGQPHQLSDYRGKWVVVNYWATWCPPCAQEIPELNLFHQAHKDTDAVVLGINFEHNDTDYVKAFMKEFAIQYPVLITTDAVMTPFGQLQGLPTTYLINPRGELVRKHLGIVDKKLLEMWIAGQAN